MKGEHDVLNQRASTNSELEPAVPVTRAASAAELGRGQAENWSGPWPVVARAVPRAVPASRASGRPPSRGLGSVGLEFHHSPMTWSPAPRNVQQLYKTTVLVRGRNEKSRRSAQRRHGNVPGIDMMLCVI